MHPKLLHLLHQLFRSALHVLPWIYLHISYELQYWIYKSNQVEVHKHLMTTYRLFLQFASFGVNIIQNSELINGTNGWFPLGNCTLSVGSGSPHILPPMASDSLGPHEPLSGHYILAMNRTQNWMGPAQMITDKLELFLTYQVAAWVKVGSTASGPQNVNIALSVDGQWVNGGQVEITDDRWHEIGGSFRIEKQPSKVMVYIQGPGPGVDLMLGSLQIFAVDRQARFKHLRRQTDKVPPSKHIFIRNLQLID